MILVVYHSPCFDGFGAALAAWVKFGHSYEGQEVKYLPTNYGKPLPFDIETLTKEDSVYVLDFCFDRESILAIEQKAKSIFVLDHHKTHFKNLEGLERISLFDMNKSGAMLAWEYFNPSLKVPSLIKCIQDRDIWLHQIEDSEYVYCGLNVYPMDFEIWQNFLDEPMFKRLVSEGKIAYRAKLKEVKTAMEKAFPAKFSGHEILAVNTTSVHISDILNELLKENPSVPFTVGFYLADGKIKFSLRSRGKTFSDGILDFDTATLCEKYGGGGHRNASGLQIELERNSLSLLPLEFVQ